MKIILTEAGKRFSREWIFRNFSYEFTDNSYAITGPNGSGKSTLLQVLSSALMLNEGKAEWQIDNRIIKTETVHHYTSLAAPYFELVEEMTGRELLLFHSKFKKFINGFAADDILIKAELNHAANKQIRFYSSGMKQRLKLAQAIFSDVPFILLDEPCTNLDENGFNLYYNWIETYCATRLLIVSSNDKNEYKFCKKQLNMQNLKQLS